MSESRAPARPSQATLAAWMVIIGSVAVVLSSFERVGGMRSLRTREAVESFLAEPPGDGLGISVQQALQFLQATTMVGAACATATAILGWFVLKRERSARLAVTVLAVPLFLTGMISGGFMSTVVAVAALLLWLQPTRSWFNGVAWEPPVRPGRGADAAGGVGGPGGPAGSSAGPAATPPVMPPQGAVPSTEARPWQGFGQVPAPAPAPEAPQPRPTAVVIACVLTWACSALVGALMLISLIVVALDPEHWLGELRKQNPQLAEQAEITDNVLAAALYFIGGVTMIWAVAAALIAFFVIRGAPWARVLLIVSASCTAVFALIGSLTNPLMIVVLIAAALTISCLLRPESRAWFRSGPRPPM